MRQVLHTASSVPEDDWQSGIVIGSLVIDMAVDRAQQALRVHRYSGDAHWRQYVKDYIGAILANNILDNLYNWTDQ